MNDPIFPKLNPPEGGHEKLMHRINLSETRHNNALFTNLIRGTVALTVATLVGVISIPRSNELDRIIINSEELVVYKFGLKSYSGDKMQLKSEGNEQLISTSFGYQLRRSNSPRDETR